MRPGAPAAARWAGALALVLVAAMAAAQAPQPSLASIPVAVTAASPASASSSASVNVGEALRLRVWAADAAGLASLLAQPVPGAPEAVDLRLPRGVRIDAGPPAEALAASFIVDHGEPAVAGLVQRLRTELGRSQGPLRGAEVVAFVARILSNAYDANASRASQVAQALRGDCTEHALLTTAIARAAGIPARMVIGAVVLLDEGRWLAYGHAWVQLHEDGRWAVHDSALAGFGGPVHHLPAAAMLDEGPGYGLGMMAAFARVPSRIELLGPFGADATGAGPR